MDAGAVYEMLHPFHLWAQIAAPCALILAAIVRSLLLIFGVAVAGAETFLLADGIARWIETAYLVDSTRAGDSLDQIPLIEAIIATIFAAAIVATGIAVTLSTDLVRDTPPAEPAV